jgi:hypothetical protein
MKYFSGRFALCFFLVLALTAVAACTASSSTEESSEPGTVQEEATEHIEEGDEHEHEEDTVRVPNEGAVIRIVSPADGATFTTADDIVVEVETENFTLGEGNHWELYVDDSRWSSVEGGATSEVIRGLEPGEHTIAVYLATGEHEELEEGATITITVEE